MSDNPEPATEPKPSRAEQRRREEFERLCNTGYSVCCGGGAKRSGRS